MPNFVDLGVVTVTTKVFDGIFLEGGGVNSMLKFT